ncbi:MAG TPA: hypothetical protein VKS21_00245 [Spirochaetota bacterium]|nr:hypothetical protein [Spirochaetota bacterium]
MKKINYCFFILFLLNCTPHNGADLLIGTWKINLKNPRKHITTAPRKTNTTALNNYKFLARHRDLRWQFTENMVKQSINGKEPVLTAPYTVINSTNNHCLIKIKKQNFSITILDYDTIRISNQNTSLIYTRD